MLLLEIDPIAVAGLIVAILGVLIAIPAAWGAVKAISYAKAAPTAKDLERVEGNTFRTSEHLEALKSDLARVEGHSAATSEHLEQMKANVSRLDKLHHLQYDVSELQQRANRIGISATGNQTTNASYKLELTAKDKDFSIVRIELINERGSLFASAPCVENDQPGRKGFYTLIQLKKMREWFNGGTPIDMLHRRRLNLRVFLILDEAEIYREVYREMSVTVTDIGEPSSFTVQGFMVEGSV